MTTMLHPHQHSLHHHHESLPAQRPLRETYPSARSPKIPHCCELERLLHQAVRYSYQREVEEEERASADPELSFAHPALLKSDKLRRRSKSAKAPTSDLEAPLESMPWRELNEQLVHYATIGRLHGPWRDHWSYSWMGDSRPMQSDMSPILEEASERTSSNLAPSSG